MKYATDWAEVVAPDEDARFAQLSERLGAVQASRTPALGPGRTLHRRPVGSVRARFTVRPDLATVLPEVLHVGPFRPGADYLTWVRFSNGSLEAPPPQEPDVRGIALKLVGVGGAKCLTGTDDPCTQDFLLIKGDRFPTKDPAEFVALVEAGAGGGKAGLPFRLASKVGFFRSMQLIYSFLSGVSGAFPTYSAARFNSVTPYRLGPTAARWGLVPVGDAPAAQIGGGLVADLRARVTTGLAWDFQVQLFQSEATTPVEDPTLAWDPAVAPWITVARLEIPPQDTASPEGERVGAYVETLAFDPWHAAEPLRPLGAVNRARKAAYYASAQARPNAPEPTGNETI